MVDEPYMPPEEEPTEEELSEAADEAAEQLQQDQEAEEEELQAATDALAEAPMLPLAVPEEEEISGLQIAPEEDLGELELPPEEKIPEAEIEELPEDLSELPEGEPGPEAPGLDEFLAEAEAMRKAVEAELGKITGGGGTFPEDYGNPPLSDLAGESPLYADPVEEPEGDDPLSSPDDPIQKLRDEIGVLWEALIEARRKPILLPPAPIWYAMVIDGRDVGQAEIYPHRYDDPETYGPIGWYVDELEPNTFLAQTVKIPSRTRKADGSYIPTIVTSRSSAWFPLPETYMIELPASTPAYLSPSGYYPAQTFQHIVYPTAAWVKIGDNVGGSQTPWGYDWTAATWTIWDGTNNVWYDIPHSQLTAVTAAISGGSWNYYPKIISGGRALCVPYPGDWTVGTDGYQVRNGFMWVPINIIPLPMGTTPGANWSDLYVDTAAGVHGRAWVNTT